MTYLPFARQSADTLDDREFSGERLLNYYVQAWPDQGRGPFILRCRAGLETEFTDLGTTDPVEAMALQDQLLYAVAGGSLYEITPAGANTRLGSVGSKAPATIAGNGNEVTVAAGGIYTVWDGSSLTTPAPGALSSALQVAHIDNFIAIIGTMGTRTDRIQVTAALDATSLDATDVATAESSPDGLVAIAVDHSEIWLFGSDTTEVWADNGGTDFPFSRIAGGVIERGCANGWTVAKEDNTIFWLGNDGIVYRANGYQPVRVSTHAVEDAIRKHGTENLRAFTYTDRGHKFYGLRFTDRPAWVYDLSTNLWAEANTGTAEGPWIAYCSERAFNKTLIGATDGKIYEMRPDKYTDAGNTISREAYSLVLNNGDTRTQVNRLSADIRTGGVDLGRDAQVMLRISRDGRTWSTEKWRNMGTVGEYETVVSWHGLGEARHFSAHLKITDPGPYDIYGVSIA